MKKIEIGIIGSGYISDYHISVLNSFKKIKIKSIYSRSIKKAKFKSIKYKIPLYFDNLNNFFKEHYDGLYLLVSADHIYEFSKKIIPRRIPLMIEKPSGLNISELRNLIKISQKYRTPNIIGTNRRYYSIYEKINKFINKENKLISILIEGHENFWKIKKLNKSKKILDNWEYANSIHNVDLLNFFSKSKVLKTFTFNNSNQKDFNLSAILKFKNGINATYVSNWSSPDRYSIKLFTEKKTFFIKPLEECYYIDRNFKKTIIQPNKVDRLYKPGFYKLTHNFINLIENKKNLWPDNNLESVLSTYQLIKMIYS